MTFLKTFGDVGGTRQVTIVRESTSAEPKRLTVTAIVQPKKAFFELTTPVYEGDLLEVPDPRGGYDTRYIKEVHVYDVDDDDMSHIEVVFGAQPSSPAPVTNSIVYNGPVVQIHGDHTQIAWGNQSATQNQVSTSEVAPGFETLAEAVVDTLARLTELGLGNADSQLVRTVGEEILEEITKPEPDQRTVNRGLAMMRGVLATLIVAGASGAGVGVRDIVEHLIQRLAGIS